MYESPITFALQIGREIHDMLWVKLYHYVLLIENVFSGVYVVILNLDTNLVEEVTSLVGKCSPYVGGRPENMTLPTCRVSSLFFVDWFNQ